MSIYSTNGVRRSVNISATLASDGMEAITQVSTPNVSQFGWTTQDLKSVKDLVKWVNAAMDAAVSAQTNADYVAESVSYVQNQTAQTDANLVHSDQLLGSSTALYNDFIVKIDPFNNNFNLFTTQYADFLSKYADFVVKWQQWYDETHPIPAP